VTELPPGPQAAYPLKAAAAALRLDERRLLAWCRSGHVPTAFQHTPGGKWYVPSAAILDLAHLMHVTPDWIAAEDA
jgi:hypothetical protein